MTGLPEKRYMRIFPIQEIGQTRRLQRDPITGFNPVGDGGFACAVQLHREVRPESGLVGIVEHIQVNKR